MDQVEGDNQKFVQIKTFLNFYHDRLSLYKPPKTPILDQSMFQRIYDGDDTSNKDYTINPDDFEP